MKSKEDVIMHEKNIAKLKSIAIIIGLYVLSLVIIMAPTCIMGLIMESKRGYYFYDNSYYYFQSDAWYQYSDTNGWEFIEPTQDLEKNISDNFVSSDYSGKYDIINFENSKYYRKEKIIYW